MEDEILYSHENLRLLDYAPNGICVVDQDFLVVFWNRCLEDWSGLSKSSIEGTDIRNYAPKLSTPRYYRRIETIFTGGPPVIFSPQLHSSIFPITLITGNPQIQYVKVTSLPCPDGKKCRALFTIEDVTELTRLLQDYREEHKKARKEIEQRKKTEAELQTSLTQKEFLLKEIHHRVKNNLSMVAGLINLQSDSVHDPRDAHILEELEKKIHSISLIHEKLYLSRDLSTFDLKEYLEELIPHIIQTTVSRNMSIDLAVDIESVQTSIDTAIPLSMIITEIMLNSLKYAFPLEEKGAIEASFSREGSEYVLRVRDNGIGLPKAMNTKSIEESETLGMRLISNFVEQLAGRLHIEVTYGTEYTIVFPKNRIEAE